MKKLLFAVSALAALSLLAPSTGFAQHVYANNIGLFMDEDGFEATGTSTIGAPVNVYLVLILPSDSEAGDTPFPSINAFECTLTFTPQPNNDLFALAMTPPPDSIDVGQSKNINSGKLDFVVGIADTNPVIVTNGSALLVSFTFLNNNIGGFEVTIGPPDGSSLPGQMGFQGVEGQILPMYPASGDGADPIFLFGGNAVSVEEESFGSIKAMFR